MAQENIKIPIIDASGKKTSDVEVTSLTYIRDDIFKKAVLVESSWGKQSYGSDPQAGKKQVIHLSRRRRKSRTTYGRSMSRIPRKVMWSRGTQFSFKGAFGSMTTGGRRAHAPKAQKNIFRNISNKEWMRALESGLSASFNSQRIASLGQRVPQTYPFMLDNSVETITKTKDAQAMCKQLGLEEEIERTSIVKIRAGRGTMRNRRYRVKRGPLFVVSSIDAPLFKAIRNIKGFDVITPEFLLVQDFGMNDKPGRMVIFTQAGYEQFKEVMM
ncbi:MAG: 50S ribosomal protein L4 [Candidatus Nanoarchaeia archaeon]